MLQSMDCKESDVTRQLNNNNMKKLQKTQTWQVDNILPNNQRIMEEIKEEM